MDGTTSKRKNLQDLLFRRRGPQAPRSHAGRGTPGARDDV